MRHRLSSFLFLSLAAAVLWPVTCPAPLIYTPGEGWTYEAVGEDTGEWKADKAVDQLAMAKEALEKKNPKLARKAAKRLVKTWPLSDYAPEAQYLVGRAYDEEGKDERAFKEYQKVIETYPTIPQYDEILMRQYQIANEYLAGKWFKLWGYIPFFPSMEKTTAMYKQIIDSGPFSEVATQSQMKIGEAREKQKNYDQAVEAYEEAADRYHDKPEVASDALYKAGMAYYKQAKTADYDQNVADQAINTFTDFQALYPEDPRIEEVNQIIAELRTEQARGSFEIARWYEKKRKYPGALIYYNEVILKDPESSLADEARKRIDAIQQGTGAETFGDAQ